MVLPELCPIRLSHTQIAFTICIYMAEVLSDVCNLCCFDLVKHGVFIHWSAPNTTCRWRALNTAYALTVVRQTHLYSLGYTKHDIYANWSAPNIRRILQLHSEEDVKHCIWIHWRELNKTFTVTGLRQTQHSL